MSGALIEISDAAKSFTLHNQGAVCIDVMRGATLTVDAGECVALVGPSGVGKSTLMRMVYGNYLTEAGAVCVKRDNAWVDVATAAPEVILDLRRDTIGYVSQFLRVIPRVTALDVVAEPVISAGGDKTEARKRAAAMLSRLNVKQELWRLPPATFSGGEQQRVNIARGFIHPFPILLLDEPTASLDTVNREVVFSLIDEAKARGAAILGIFHDTEARARVADRKLDVSTLVKAA